MSNSDLFPFKSVHTFWQHGHYKDERDLLFDDIFGEKPIKRR